MALRTRLCDVLGIDFPVLCAPMGAAITSPELAAAVSNAGALGIISYGVNPPFLLRELIQRMRALTDRPFGVNFLLQFPVQEQVALCIEERVPVLSFFWGDASPFVERAHDAGLKVVDQVGSAAAAMRSMRAGVDAIIAQGVEAGGHVAGRVSTMALIPRVVDAVAPIPVVAAGGIAGARGFAAALALGAQGIAMGTRFLATPESNAHPEYKRRVVSASEEDTVRTTLFGGGWPDAPHRTLRTRFVEEWLPHEPRGSEQRADEPTVGQASLGGRRIPVARFMNLPPAADAEGDIESMSLLAGQSAGQIHEIIPAARIVEECVAGACRIIEELALLGRE